MSYPTQLLLTILLGMTVAASALAQSQPVEPQADWQLPDSLRDNQLRGDVVLNGYWRQSIGEKVNRVIVPVGMAQVKEGTHSLYREFVVPAAWQGRRLTLEPGMLTADGELRIDGEPVATLKRNKRFVELDIPGKTGRRTIEIITAGKISEDVWLRSYPAGDAGVDDTFIIPSFRQKRITVRLAGRGVPGQALGVRVAISETPDADPIKRFEALVTPGVDGRWSAEPATDWADPRLWSRYRPNLYWYTVELTDEAGTVLDKVLPRRFGFREIWVENGQWIVNGVQTNYISDSWGGQLDRGATGNSEHTRQLMRALKRQGQTFSHWGPRSEAGLNVAAEEGVLCMMPAGSLVRLNIWDPRNGLTTMTGDEAEDDIVRTVRRFREQPSILGWTSAAGYSQASMHPEYNALPFQTWKFFPLNRDTPNAFKAQMQFREAQKLIAGIDPTRTVNFHNGPWTSVDMTTKYLTNNLDLQEREEFMEDWFNRHPQFRQVVSSTEVGVPFPGEMFLRKIDFQLTQTKGNVWRIFMEMGARYEGESAYLSDSDEEIAGWTKTDSYAARANPIYQRLYEEAVRNTYRAWRAYGANWVGHHILSEDSFVHGKRKPVEKKTPAAPIDPRQPGYAAGAAPTWPLPETAELLPTGHTLIATSQPLMAYIGGPDRRFISKDHLYYAGTPVRKAIIVVNDWDDPASLSGGWTVTDPSGAIVAKGDVSASIQPGQRLLTELPIEFAAPDVSKRSDYTIHLDLKSDRPGTLSDKFAITVFPTRKAPALPKFAGQVWTLNISDDLTHETPHFLYNRENDAVLKSMGLDAKLLKGLREFEYIDVSLGGAMAWHDKRKLVTEGTPKPGDLLIIPRHTLAADADGQQLNVRLLGEMKLDQLVEQGLRVLVLEQNLDNLFGLQQETVRPRRTFMGAKGHPVFSGLEEGDLSYWSGSSDLCPATDPISPSDNSFPDRLWHVSNTNAVASRTPVRPQVGAARALVVSGFDLQESPLLEVTRGKGRIIFCQMDVTNRYGVDPAATRLLDNVVSYLMTAPEPDPAKAEVPVVNENVQTRRNLYRAPKPEGEAGWGITNGELFFRESVFNDTYGTKPELSVPVFDEANHVIRPGAGGGFEMSLAPETMKTGWGKRKILWLRSTLIVNQGGSTMEGPALRHHGRITDLYPIPWVQGFVHPYNANIW